LDPQTQSCTLRDRCDDGDPCTIDTCDDVHQTCSYESHTNNLLNATIVYSCNQSTGEIFWNGQPGSAVVPLTGCSDGNPDTVDSYNPNTQRCVHQLIVNDTSLNVVSCLDSASFVTNPNTIVSNTVVNGFYVCANPSQICVNGSCVYSRDESVACFYTAPVLVTEAVGTVSGTVSNVVFQTVYDDSKCPLFIFGKTYATCSPFSPLGSYTKSGCCQCGDPLSQGLIVFLADDDCVCCQADNDCVDIAHCNPFTNKCELNP